MSVPVPQYCRLTQYQYWAHSPGMPETGTLKTAPVVQSAVIGLRAQGKSKRSISRELGIHRKTVDNVLDVMQADDPTYATVLQRLTNSALARVEQVIPNDTDTAKWTLEHTLFRGEPASVPVVQDHSLHLAVGFVPSGTSTASTPSLPSSTSTPTEAPQKDRLVNLDLSKHENFSQIPDSALLAELERRGYRTVAKPIEATDAEVIESNE